LYRLLACAGTGSAIAEALLELAGLPYEVEPVDPWSSEADAKRLAAFNPLVQLPTLLMPDGSVMSESAAITLHIADRAPDAGLAPPPGAPVRAAFLRWLAFLVASLYPTFTFGDDPSRWVSDDAAQTELRERTDRHRERLWGMVEAIPPAAPWFLGASLTALDIYVAVMTHWRPRRAWFAQHCPRLHAIAVALDGEPRLRGVWARNFP